MSVFTFDPAAGRYRDQSGALVPDTAIRRALDHVITGSAQRMREMSQALLDGTQSLASWQLRMMGEIKSAHLVASTLATGGWAQMDQSDFGFVGQRIRSQYAFLRSFAADIASGRQPWNGTIAARSELYAEAARQTHRAAVQREAIGRGVDQERNVLGIADHCTGCLDATAEGWVDVGSLPPPGARQCMARCHCFIDYRTRRQAAAA